MLACCNSNANPAYPLGQPKPCLQQGALPPLSSSTSSLAAIFAVSAWCLCNDVDDVMLLVDALGDASDDLAGADLIALC